ncbi:MAG TPA: VOC family protein [Allosphingosinicella sp.]
MAAAATPRFLWLLLFGLLAACAGGPRELPYQRPTNVAPPPLALDHAWMVVPNGGGPERALLEAAGFRFAPTVNRHDGQGTSSITIEFENGYFELISPDDSVPASGGGELAKARFVSRMNWRTTRDSPFGIGFSRTAATPTPFPFETWGVAASWMSAGSTMEILSPRGSPTVTLFVTPQPVDAAANRATIAAGGAAAEPFLHPNGARRLTGVQVSAPTRAGLPPSSTFVNLSGAAQLLVGTEWLMELELDHGGQNQSVDLRPRMPLVIRY